MHAEKPGPATLLAHLNMVAIMVRLTYKPFDTQVMSAIRKAACRVRRMGALLMCCACSCCHVCRSS